MNLIDAFEESIHLLQERGAINRELFKMTSFDLVAFQANEVRQGLALLEDALDAS